MAAVYLPQVVTGYPLLSDGLAALWVARTASAQQG
jgi:hypothetical protein